MSKVKMKTRKALKGRFKVTGTGKLMRHKQGRRHILTKKSSKKKRDLARPTETAAGYAKLYTRLLGGAS